MNPPIAHWPRWVVSVFILYRLASSVGHADAPLPACVFYGEVRDEYGVPYLGDAEVILRVGGRECSRWPILGMLTPGVNFRLVLELDDGTDPVYAAYAARPGQTVTLSVRAQGGETPILEKRALVVGQPGDLIEVNVTRGTDADDDGLPDEWEQRLIANSAGTLTGITQVQPEDDFDGDGVCNLEEYLGGTYPFLNDDYFCVEETTLVENDRLRLRFLTTLGMSYQVMATDRLGPDAEWQLVPFAVSAGTAPDHDDLVGNGFYADVYVTLSIPFRFFCLQAR